MILCILPCIFSHAQHFRARLEKSSANTGGASPQRGRYVSWLWRPFMQGMSESVALFDGRPCDTPTVLWSACDHQHGVANLERARTGQFCHAQTRRRGSTSKRSSKKFVAWPTGHFEHRGVFGIQRRSWRCGHAGARQVPNRIVGHSRRLKLACHGG